MTKVLLSISVPTYNRADLLDICLDNIFKQVESINEDIEVIVSNNASTDHTRQIVAKFQDLYPRLRYFENEKNGGPDFNIARCFELAQGKYVWVFSDDDLLLPGAISHVMSLLKKQELGVIFLKARFYKHFINETAPVYTPFEYQLHSDALEFLTKLHYWTTYITGTITNKDLVKDCASLYRYQDSYLIQLGWVLPALFRAKQNAYVSSELILGRALDVLDFKPFRVFGTFYPKVLRSMVAHGDIPPEAEQLLVKLVLQIYFLWYFQPHIVFPHRERPLLILGKSYWRRGQFWQSIVPALINRSYHLGISAIQQPFRNLLKKGLLALHRKTAELAHNAATEASAKALKQFGPRSVLPTGHVLINPQFITIGSHFSALSKLIIEARTVIAGQPCEPSIVIGNGVKMGADCRLDCCNSIQLAELVMLGDRVLIADNELDDSPESIANYAPLYRPRKTLGSIILETNVLIEDDVRIFSGVTIGQNTIVRAGAVVRSSMPANTVVAGNPASVIENFELAAYIV